MTRNDYFTYLNDLEKNDNRFDLMKQYAVENNVPIIQTEGIVFLQHLIRLTKAKKILEIGSAIGYSAIQMALVDSDVKITTIEREIVMVEEAKKNIRDFGLEDRIQLIHADAIDFDETTLDQDYDLIFIDAAKGQYQRFFTKYSQCLKQTGVIVTDNLIFHDLVFATIRNRNLRKLVNKIKAYNEWLKDNQAFYTYFYPIGDGIAVSIKK